YSIYLKPDYSQPGPYELDPAPGDKGTRLIGSKTKWYLVKNNEDTVFAEKDISILNEQIIAKYGLSIGVKQVVRPGDNQQEDRNGLIGSEIIFSDPKIAWLAGVNDGEVTSKQNWIRSGGYTFVKTASNTEPECNINDKMYDTTENYERL